MLLKIGELAARTGLTVRTLHHYDSIGLLTPSARSASGYRLYDRSDIGRLHRIQALGRLDLSLAEIGTLLTGEGSDLRSIIEQQIEGLERQLIQTAQLRDRLKDLHEHLAVEEEADIDDWLGTLEMMSLYDKYFTKEEIENKKQNRRKSRWTPLVTEVRAMIDANVPTHSEAARSAVARWMALAKETMGEDPRVFRKIDAMHRNEPSVQALTGVDGTMIDYIMQAATEANLVIYAKYVDAPTLERARKCFHENAHVWPALVAEMRQQMEQGASPDQPALRALLLRWGALADETWGTDESVRQTIRAAHLSEPGILLGTGINRDMIDFIGRGFAYLKGLPAMPPNPESD